MTGFNWSRNKRRMQMRRQGTEGAFELELLANKMIADSIARSLRSKAKPGGSSCGGRRTRKKQSRGSSQMAVPVGTIDRIGNTYLARDAGGLEIGSFTKRRAAVHAINQRWDQRHDELLRAA
jgi:hypothetical protein